MACITTRQTGQWKKICNRKKQGMKKGSKKGRQK